MELNIRAGKRVLYKDGKSSWLVGILDYGNAELNTQGLYLPIIPIEFANMQADDIPYIQYAEINQVFLEAVELEDWMKSNLLTKEEYIKIINEEDFERALENAWVSDGEYYYYPVSKFNENWIMKQPFDYILRSN